MSTQDSRKLKGQEEGVVAAMAVPSIAIPSTEGEAAAVSDGYFSNQPRAPTGGECNDAGFNAVDFDTPAPPYTPSHSLFPPPPKRTCGPRTTTMTRTTISQARGIVPPDSTRLQIPRPPTRVYAESHDNDNDNSNSNSNNAGSPATPMSQHSMRSFETARDLEKGSLKLKLTRSTTYRLLKPFFSRSSSDPAGGAEPALNVSKRKSTIIAATVLALTIVLVMGLLFGLMKWFD